MKPVPPHHLLSAYLDGELSAGEREQVEHLLEQSADARLELRELERVGELLRQLPRESLPKTFALRLMEICQSDTAVFAGETLTQQIPSVAEGKSRTNGPPNPAASGKRKTGRLGLATLGISAALAVIVMLNWPRPAEETRDALALKTPADRAAETSGPRQEPEADELAFPMAAGEGFSRDALNEARFGQAEDLKRPNAGSSGSRQDFRPKLGQAEDLKRPNAEDGPQIPQAANSEALRNLSVEEAERETPLRQQADLKEALDQKGEQVAIVKLVVGDRRQGLRDLQALLERHQIAELKNPAPNQAKSLETDAAKDSSLVAVLVEAGDDRLAAAIGDLQKHAAFQNLSIEPPIPVAQLDPLLALPSARFNRQPSSRGMRFGGASGRSFRGPDARRGTQLPKPTAITAPATETAPAEASKPNETKPKPAREPAKNLPDRAEEKSPDKPAPAPSLAGSNSLPPLDLPDKPGAAKAQMAAPAAGAQTAPATQRQLAVPAEFLDSLQKQAGQSPAQESEASAEKKSLAGKRVQVLFILVDQAGD